MNHNNKQLSLWERPHKLYIAVAFSFSWIVWVGAWLLSRSIGTGDILFNIDLLWAPLSGGENFTSMLFFVSLISLTAVYGPMLGAYAASRIDKSISWQDIWKSSTRFKSGTISYIKKVFLILFAVTAIPLIVTMVSTDVAQNAPGLFGALLLMLLFFVVQVFTSGTEEIGWRGYLTEKLLVGRDFWDTGWLVGVVWAVWHFPVVIIMFMQQGMVHVQIVGSLIGFTMGIIAMSIIHAWFYAQTRQVSLNIFIHALFNAIPLTLAVLYVESPAAFLSNILLWLVVIYIKHVADKKNEQTKE